MPRDDTPEGARTPGSRLRLRNWKLRSKLALVLAIPTVTALVLGGLRASDELQQADTYDQTTDQVDLALKVTDVVHQLQTERMLAIARVITPGNVDLQSALNRQTQQVDTSITALRTTAKAVEADEPSISQSYQQGLQPLDTLPSLRATVNTPPYSEQAAFTTYTSIISSLVQLGHEVTAAVNDRELLRLGTGAQAVGDDKEFTAEQDALTEIALMRNGFTDITLDLARGAEASADAAYTSLKANATQVQLQRFNETVSGPDIYSRDWLAVTALQRGDSGTPLGISRDEFAADSAGKLTKMRTAETELLGDLRGRAKALADAANAAAWRSIGIVIGALVAALLLTYLVARIMLRPLRVLRHSALDIAYTRLPDTVAKILADPDPVAAASKAVEPVPIHTKEEVGQLARSFDEVHEQAVRMAAEQALLRENVNGIFVNLSRRSQRLVERQLGVIDRLEADEQDPDHLASLFELDHLATRLRRNGESLLVLSGAGLAKSVPKPTSAADVIGAAVSEIEQYARVEVGVIPEVAVRGLTVHDLVHLLAELLDNATYFSEPETKVSVRAAVTRQQSLAIQVTDRGVGMSDEQVAEVNERLAEPPDLDVSVTRRMGLYVVARLAKRHGIEVHVRENEDIDGGVIARVLVPAELLGPVPETVPAPPTLVETSLPDIPHVPAQRPRPASTAVEETPGPGELTPLDQPISLDDLVKGSPDAAYLSPGPTPNGHTANAVAPLQLPKREPRYVPVAPAEPEAQAPASGSEDDAPTRRLPIYQSVVSRWFSDEDDSDEDLEQSMTGDLGEFAESEIEEPLATPGDLWRSAGDDGWQAAEALLEPKGEEITPSGLPKRVPNAYLVPGSVSMGDAAQAFTDTTSAKPGHSAIARSATAARERMASFQRGYQSGRHAVRDSPEAEESVSVRGGELSPSDAAVRSDE